jgi:hypothetical protein
MHSQADDGFSVPCIIALGSFQIVNHTGLQIAAHFGGFATSLRVEARNVILGISARSEKTPVENANESRADAHDFHLM